MPIGLSLFAKFDNPLLTQVINGRMQVEKSYCTSHQALLAIASEPLVSDAGTDAGSVSGLFNAQALLKDTRDKKLSTKDG